MSFDPGLRYSQCAGPCQRENKILHKVWFHWFGHTFPLNLCFKCQLTLLIDLLKGKLGEGRKEAR
jgi:hypothetical protein